MPRHYLVGTVLQDLGAPAWGSSLFSSARPSDTTLFSRPSTLRGIFPSAMDDYKSPISPGLTGFASGDREASVSLLGMAEPSLMSKASLTRGLKVAPWKRRRFLLGSCAMLSVISILCLTLYTWSGSDLRTQQSDEVVTEPAVLIEPVEPVTLPALDKEVLNRTARALLGAPTARIRGACRSCVP